MSVPGNRRPRRAVLGGVGEARNDPRRGDAPTDAVALMVTAAGTAAADLGDPAVLDDVGVVAATVGSDDSPDPAGAVREMLGLSKARTVVAAIGASQQRLVSKAILAVERGDVDAVLVLGGEARASEGCLRRNGAEVPEPRRGPGADDLLTADDDFMDEAEVAAMLWDPVAQYALIDSALARVEGRSPSTLRDEVSELWAQFDAVASGNPDALFAGARTAAELSTVDESNRLLAYPYNKWHCTQWTLDHAAALLICTEDVARRRGGSDDHMLYPQVALDSSWGLSLSRRAEPHRWPAMAVMGDRASEHLGMSIADLELQELYSCFPAAVRVQQRELDLPLDGTPTVLGGMAFAGGPFNHFTYMVTAEMARRLRAGSAQRALITTVSGLLTKAGLMVWGRDPHPEGALVADLADEVRGATAIRAVATFDANRRILAGDTVLAATITGGLEPRLFALAEDSSGVRHLVAAPAPTGDPGAVLSALLRGRLPA